MYLTFSNYGLPMLYTLLETTIAIVVLTQVAFGIGLVDQPSPRKKHVGEVPLVGGLGIFFGAGFTLLLHGTIDYALAVILVGSCLFLMIGVFDDAFDLSATTKLFFEVIVSSSVAYMSGLYITNMGQLPDAMPLIQFGVMSVPITVILVVCLSNSFNLMDGVDGLAGGLGIIAIMGLLIFGVGDDSEALTVLLLSLTSALIAFLMFNLSEATKFKVFLGDGGSLFLGYTIVWAAIYSTKSNPSFQLNWILWCFAMPVFDTFAVMTLRLRAGEGVFVADRRHIHHLLLDFGISKLQAVFSILVSAGTLLFFGLLLEKGFPNVSVVVFLALMLIYTAVRLIIQQTAEN